MTESEGKIGKAAKIIGYWAKTQLYYRQPKGEEAGEKLREILDADTLVALFQITGLCGDATILGNKEKLVELVKMVEGKNAPEQDNQDRP